MLVRRKLGTLAFYSFFVVSLSCKKLFINSDLDSGATQSVKCAHTRERSMETFPLGWEEASVQIEGDGISKLMQPQPSAERDEAVANRFPVNLAITNPLRKLRARAVVQRVGEGTLLG